MRRVVPIVLLLAVLACRKEKPLTTDLAVENKVAMRPVSLFYEGPSMLLVSEQREVALPEKPAAALPVVMAELLKGSSNAGVPRLFPEDTVVRGAYLLPEGTAVVDLGGPTLVEGWTTGTHQELMAIQSVVQTVTSNFADTKRVRVLVNGSPADTLGGHLSLSHPFIPVPGLVQK